MHPHLPTPARPSHPRESAANTTIMPLLPPIDTTFANRDNGGGIDDEDELCRHHPPCDDDETVSGKAMATPSPQAVHEFENCRLRGSHRDDDPRDHEYEDDVDCHRTPASSGSDVEEEAAGSPILVRSWSDGGSGTSPEAVITGRSHDHGHGFSLSHAYSRDDSHDGNSYSVTDTNVSDASEVVSDLIASHVHAVNGNRRANTNANVNANAKDVTLPDLSEPEDERLDENDDDDDDDDDCHHEGENDPAEISIASPSKTDHRRPIRNNPTALHLGPERLILFHTESLGLKLARATDGVIRVLSVTPYRSLSGSDETYRTGTVREGDVVRAVAGVDLRFPMEKSVWKLVVGLIKMAPRPLEMVVAQELESEEWDWSGGESESRNDRDDDDDHHGNNWFEDVRRVYFMEHALGIKLHHDAEGYVRILAVVPSRNERESQLWQDLRPQEGTEQQKQCQQYMANISQHRHHPHTQPQPQPHSTTLIQRQGTIYPGDYVLEVGGVWDLHQPISLHAWTIMVKFIRECRRPLCMVLAKRKNRGSNSSTGTSNRCTTATTAEDDDEHDDEDDDEEENIDNDDDNDDIDGIHLSNATSLDVVKEEMHNTGDDIEEEEEEEAEGNYDDDNDCDCDGKEQDDNGANNQLTEQHQLERRQSLEFGRYSCQARMNNHCLDERVGTLSS
ncbi:hypothetical protein ACHAXS_006935 [Conticribra weissflogii]